MLFRIKPTYASGTVRRGVKTGRTFAKVTADCVCTLAPFTDSRDGAAFINIWNMKKSLVFRAHSIKPFLITRFRWNASQPNLYRTKAAYKIVQKVSAASLNTGLPKELTKLKRLEQNNRNFPCKI